MDARAYEERRTYRITVRGHLDGSWEDWLSGMSISAGRTNDGTLVTTLTGPVVDQSALRGLRNRLWDLNLTLISVTSVTMGSSDEEANR